MLPNRSLNMLITLAATIVSQLIGCDDRATQIATTAADRQAQQNLAMADLQKEVAGGTRSLVAADAEAREAAIGVHHDLQAERARLDNGWTTLDKERRQVALERRTESLFVPVVEALGGVLLVVVLLAFCWRVLGGLGNDGSEQALNKLLLEQFLTDSLPPLPAADLQPPLSSEPELRLKQPQ